MDDVKIKKHFEMKSKILDLMESNLKLREKICTFEQKPSLIKRFFNFILKNSKRD